MLDKTLTVVICSYNGENILKDCINSLCNQTYNNKDVEIIIIDNNSDDKTSEIALSFCKKKSYIKTYFEQMQGLSFARNHGLEKAKGKYVAYIDDDARVNKNWIEVAIDIIKNKEPDIFGGPVYPIFPEGKPEWYKNEYGVRGYMGETGWLKEGFIIGSNMFFKKSLLIELGGFNPNLGMIKNKIKYHEETELIYKAFELGKNVYYSNELALNDIIPEFKKHLLFFLSSWYFSGKDYNYLKKPNFNVDDFPKLIEKIEIIFENFEKAVKTRNIDDFKFPENYVVENLKNDVFQLGRMIDYFKNKVGEN